jgi:hypothetical protein
MPGVFALSPLVHAAAVPAPIPYVSGTVDLRALPSEYRFPVAGVPALRLPKRPQKVAEALAAAGEQAPMLWSTLTGPVHRVPLTAPADERRAALITGCRSDPGVAIVEARVAVRSGASRHGSSDLVEVSLAVAPNSDAAVDLLEVVWRDALPAARSAARGARLLWLGGDPGRSAAGGELRVRGVCAAFGLRAEVVVDASRHLHQLSARVGSSPPTFLAVWQPEAFGVEPVVRAFRAASEGEVVTLTEPALEDALLELRWALADLGLDGSPPPEATAEGRPVPVVGEERYYIKHHGTKTGDRMIEVADCGHGQWGSDQQRKAPRASKGIAGSVGVSPAQLFLCAKCTKNRWRARF